VPPPPPSRVEPVRPVLQPPSAELVVEDAGTPNACVLAGRVLSRTTQQGVANAELTFEHHGTATSVRSGPDGTFALTTDREGAWSLAAIVADGFHAYAPQWGHSPFEVHLQKGARVAGLRFALAPKVDYQGRVLSPAGTPVGGAEIRILGGNHALVAGADEKVSGPDGRFLFQAEDGAVLVARTRTSFWPARWARRWTSRPQ
jgi:hypothetical protein